MTITFTGHIESVKSHIDGKLEVTLVTPQEECGHNIKIKVPKTEAGKWLVGTTVQFTIYTLPEQS